MQLGSDEEWRGPVALGEKDDAKSKHFIEHLFGNLEFLRTEAAKASNDWWSSDSVNLQFIPKSRKRVLVQSTSIKIGPSNRKYISRIQLSKCIFFHMS